MSHSTQVHPTRVRGDRGRAATCRPGPATDPAPGKRRRYRDDRGAAVVEFALVVPLLMAILLGTVTAGIAFNQKLQLSHATREGARYAASIPPNQAFVSGTWATNVRDLILARSAGDLDLTTGTVCVSLVEGSAGSTSEPLRVVTTSTRAATYFSTTGSPCISGETYPISEDDPGRRVQITSSRPAEVEAIVYSWEGTMRTEATAKSESSQ